MVHVSPESVQFIGESAAVSVSSLALAHSAHHFEVACRGKEDVRVGVFRRPFAEFHFGWFGGELEFFALVRPGDGIKGAFLQGVPDGSGVPVVEKEDIVEGVSGRAEFDGFVFVDLAVANCSQLGERSPTDGKRCSVEIVVDDFVTVQNLDRVCFRHPVVLETDDDGVVIDACLCETGITDLGKLGLID